MFTRRTEHAMRIVVYLADRGGGWRDRDAVLAGIRIGDPEFAEAIAPLLAGGVVEDAGGRYRLTRPAEQVTMFDVVQCMAPIERISECPLGLEGHGPNLCPLHRRMDNAALALEQAFRRSTIAQLLVEPTTSRPLCNFPRAEGTPPA